MIKQKNTYFNIKESIISKLRSTFEKERITISESLIRNEELITPASYISRQLIDDILQLTIEDSEQFYDKVLSFIKIRMNADEVIFYRYSETNNKLYPEKYSISKNSSLSGVQFIKSSDRYYICEENIDGYKRGEIKTFYKEESFPACLNKAVKELNLKLQSAALIPLYNSRRLYGLIGIGMEKNREKWGKKEKELLKLFAKIMVNKIQHIESKEELEKSNHFAELSMERSGIYHWEYDGSEDYFKKCDSLERRLGLSLESGFKITPKTLLEYIHPNDSRQLKASFKELFENKTELFEEARIRSTIDASESYEWFRFLGIPLNNETGEKNYFIGTITCINKDKIQQKTLEEYKRKNELVRQASNIVDWQYNIASGCFTSEQENFIFKFSMTFDEFIKKIHPNNREEYLERFRQLINNEVDNIHLNLNLLIEEEYRWVSSFGSISKQDEKGKPVELAGLCFDINNEVNRLEISEKERKLTHTFIANISHEIRTPLNAIQGFSQLIAETANSPESKEYAEQVMRNTEQLLNLFHDILELSYLDSGTRKLELIECNINALLRDWECDAKIQLINSPLKVSIEYSEALKKTMLTDPSVLTQVVTNLVNNAAKFTKEGEITIGYRPEGESEIYFFVRDTGCGIPIEQHKEIFTRFVKLDNFKQGTGLGLSICKNIIKALGGKIGVKSEVGKGSEFWFILPYNK